MPATRPRQELNRHATNSASLHSLRLKHADAVTFSIDERRIKSNARNVIWLTIFIMTSDYLATFSLNIFYCVPDIVHADNHRRVLVIWPLIEETAVNSPGSFGAIPFISFSGANNNVVSHVGTQLLSPPAKSFFIKFRHAGPV